MNWQILEKIASGSFGTVYIAQNKINQEELVALKIFHQKFFSLKNKIRFKKNFFSASKVNHINCLKILDWYEKENDFGFVMELVALENRNGGVSSFKSENQNLFETSKIATIEEKILKIIQVCNGLEALHSKGIVHKNLKPENILCTFDGIIKITDFDLIGIENFLLTEKGNSFLRTIGYASPELCQNLSQIDNRSDLYSLGVIFYELLTGKLPFEVKGLAQEAATELSIPNLAFPENLTTEIPNEIKLFISKLLQRYPEDRFYSAREIAAKLHEFLGTSEEFETSVNYIFAPTFVNRKEELGTIIEKVFAKSQESSFQKILVFGESGVGKTKFIEEFRSKLSNRNVKYFSICCEKEDKAYESLQKILLQAVTYLSKISNTEKSKILGRFAWDLIKILPQLSEMPFMNLIEKLPELSSRKSQELRLFQATFDFFQNLIELEEEKVIFIFDDAQNLDEKTFNWLEAFSEKLKESPILLILISNVLQDRFAKRFQEIKLKSLNLESLNEMLASILGQSEFGQAELTSEIFRRTEGIPLFVETFVQDCLKKGNLKFNKGSWEMIFDETVFKASNSEQVFSERLSKISSEARTLLEVEAVLKSGFDFQALLELTAFDESKFFAVLDEVKEIGLVTEKYSFRHGKILEILKENLIGKKRQNLHSRVAFFLEKEFTGKEEQIAIRLAEHFTEAEETKKAIFFNDLAGEISKEKFDFKRALNYFQNALELFGNRKEKNQEIKLRFKISRVLGLLGEKKKEKKVLEEIRQIALEKRYEKLLAESNIALALLLKDLKYFSQVELLLEEAFQVAQNLDDIVLEIEIMRVYGLTDFARGNYKKALKNFSKQLKYSEKFKYLEGKINSLENLGLTYQKLGRFKKATQYFNEVLKKGNLLARLNSCLNLGEIYFKQKKYKKAILFYEKSLTFYEFLGEETLKTEILTSIEKAKLKLGNLEKSIDKSQGEKEINLGKNTEKVFNENQKNESANVKQKSSSKENFVKEFCKLETQIGCSPQNSQGLFSEEGFGTKGMIFQTLERDSEESYLEIFNEIVEKESLNEKIAILEKFVTEETLRKHKGNITHSARDLGIDTKRMRRILKRYNILKEQFLA